MADAIHNNNNNNGSRVGKEVSKWNKNIIQTVNVRNMLTTTQVNVHCNTFLIIFFIFFLFVSVCVCVSALVALEMCVCVCVFWLNIVPAKVACTKFCFCCFSLLHSLLSFSLFLFCNNVWSVTQATTPSVQASCSTSVTRIHTAVAFKSQPSTFLWAPQLPYIGRSVNNKTTFLASIFVFFFCVCWESIDGERHTPFLCVECWRQDK